ncbi:MAG: TAXI family TRAP transporter solute-binding subunit [Acetobacteraceae bacterium]|nr:TAXI family TRAP transporter solute-binding subunit [Acetobacteraceae bacterium]
MRRRSVLAAPLVMGATPVMAQGGPLRFHSAGPGSAFLPYAEGVARHLNGEGIAVEVRQSAGSLENLSRVEDEATGIGTAFLGSVWDALQGTPAARGRRHANIRALWPMYETSFQVVAPEPSGLTRFAQLDGKRVGAGPAAGPAETFLRAAAEAAGISITVVSGTPAEMSAGLLSGAMDALWQGAIVPIPSILAVLRERPARVFGPGEEVAARVTQRLPYLSPTALPPGTYPGQAEPVHSFAAWNFVVANRALPDDVAYRVTRAVLTAPAGAMGPSAAATQARHAGTNRILPFHPGAARFYAEAGVALAAPAG